jgi:hypothetical protein
MSVPVHYTLDDLCEDYVMYKVCKTFMYVSIYSGAYRNVLVKSLCYKSQCRRIEIR